MEYISKKVKSNIVLDEYQINLLSDFYKNNFAMVARTMIKKNNIVANCMDNHDLFFLRVSKNDIIEITVMSDSRDLCEKVGIILEKYFAGMFVLDDDLDNNQTYDIEAWVIMHEYLIKQQEEINKKIEKLERQMEELNIDVSNKKTK